MWVSNKHAGSQQKISMDTSCETSQAFCIHNVLTHNSCIRPALTQTGYGTLELFSGKSIEQFKMLCSNIKFLISDPFEVSLMGLKLHKIECFWLNRSFKFLVLQIKKCLKTYPLERSFSEISLDSWYQLLNLIDFVKISTGFYFFSDFCTCH